jgi:hypothetical protein
MTPKQNEPEKDPNLGVFTPIWAKWAVANMSEGKFKKLFNMTKADAHAIHPEIFGLSTEKVADDTPVNDISKTQTTHSESEIEALVDRANRLFIENDFLEKEVIRLQAIIDSIAPLKAVTPTTEPLAAVEAPPEEEAATPAEPTDEAQVAIDLKEMHHKTFQKQYGLTKDEYKSKADLI